MRAAIYWPQIQPNGPADANFSAPDALVLAAAARGLEVLPVIQSSPGWAALNPGDPSSPPRDPADVARLMTALVTRYGPNGSLWAEHPEIARRPIRSWQVWNEPNMTRYWNVAPWAPSYVKMLKAAHKALNAADPKSADDPRGPSERELEGAQGDLRRRRARLVRRRRTAPVHRAPEERGADREDRAPRDGPARRRARAGVADGAVVAGGEGQDRPAPRLRDHRQRPGRTAEGRAAAAGRTSGGRC